MSETRIRLVVAIVAFVVIAGLKYAGVVEVERCSCRRGGRHSHVRLAR